MGRQGEVKRDKGSGWWRRTGLTEQFRVVKVVSLEFVSVSVFVFDIAAQCWLSRSDKERSRETKVQGEEEPALLNNSDLWKLFSWNMVCLCLCICLCLCLCFFSLHCCPVLAVKIRREEIKGDEDSGWRRTSLTEQFWLVKVFSWNLACLCLCICLCICLFLQHGCPVLAIKISREKSDGKQRLRMRKNQPYWIILSSEIGSKSDCPGHNNLIWFIQSP